MKHTIRRFAREVVVIAAVMLLFFASQLAASFIMQGGMPAFGTPYDITDFRHVNNLYNRSLNQLTGVIFTTVAIAVPLTANMYSLKFLDFFLKDPVNAVALILVILTNATNTWTGYVSRTSYIPILEFEITTMLTLLCYALVFPYLYYIFRFLHPHTLLERLIAETGSYLARTVRRPQQARSLRPRMAASVEHIASIAERSVDRIDRNTAIESVAALDHVMRRYWSVKTHLPAGWFAADKSFFLGYSSAAIEDMTATRSWVEMKVFGQYFEVLKAATPRMPELTSAVAESLRMLGLEEAARSDPALRELVVEYFNTFVRLALTRRDVRSVFFVFNQYRHFAQEINSEAPDLVNEIAYYFRYYAQIARDMQLNFVVEAVAHDLGMLVQAAWAADAPNRQDLLAQFLDFDAQAAQPLPGVKKAQAILASYFLVNGHDAAAQQIREIFTQLDARFKRQIYMDLVHIKRDKYWEVNERRINIDYMPDDQREKLSEFFEGG
jgi:hypothetical protein